MLCCVCACISCLHVSKNYIVTACFGAVLTCANAATQPGCHAARSTREACQGLSAAPWVLRLLTAAVGFGVWFCVGRTALPVETAGRGTLRPRGGGLSTGTIHSFCEA